MKTIKYQILLLLIGMVVFPANGQKSKQSKHRTYKCKQVGKQKVHTYKFSKKEKEQEKTMVHNPSKTLMVELAEKKKQAMATVVAAKKSKVVSEPSIPEVEMPIPLPSPVYFIFDSDGLQIVDIYQIALAVQHAKEGRDIYLTGHTDSEGTADYNKELSVRRANKIKEMMLQMDPNLDPDKIHVAGKGEEEPAVDNDSVDHRLENRRVEFLIIIE